MLTIIGAALTWFAWRRRGLAAGLRGLAWTLLPVAAWLTGTLKLVTGIVDDVVSWAASWCSPRPSGRASWSPGSPSAVGSCPA